MKILFLADVFPYPAFSGGRLRTYNILKQMSKDFENIDFYCINESIPEKGDITYLLKYAKKVEVFFTPKKSAKERLFNIFKNRSDKLFLNYSEQYKESINNILKSEQYDIIYSDSLWMYQYIYKNNLIDRNKTKLIIDLHNVEHEVIYRMMQASDSLPAKVYSFIEYKKIKKLESLYSYDADKIFTVSERDRDRYVELYDINTDKIEVIYNGFDVSIANNYDNRIENLYGRYLLFVGSLWYRPNYEGITWFIKDIWPQVKEKYKDLRLIIIGKYDEKNIAHGDDVEYLGFVDDIYGYYQNCIGTVVPLRMGSGTRLKILESMAFKVPVISTTIGYEGINAIDESNILVADNGLEFMKKIEFLFNDSEGLIKNEGYKLVSENYDWSKIGLKLNSSIKNMCNK